MTSPFRFSSDKLYDQKVTFFYLGNSLIGKISEFDSEDWWFDPTFPSHFLKVNIMFTDDDKEVWNEVIKGIEPLCVNNIVYNKNIVKSIDYNKNKIEYILDLHGFSVQEAYNKVYDFIKLHYERKSKYIIVITGKGLLNKEGLIHKEIILWLNTKKFKKYIKIHEWINHGGALKIVLNKSKL